MSDPAERTAHRRKAEPWPVAAAIVFVLGIGALIAAAQMRSDGSDLAPAQRAEIEAVVRDYLLSHPEIIPEAVEVLQQRQVALVVQENREAIETPFASAWAGAEDGDVVLVEFFDYNCPYCRMSHPVVQRLLKEDAKLKVVYRDHPVLGEKSMEAALASLSAAEQGRFKRFYDAMFESEGRLSTEKIVAAVRAAGLDEAKTAADMKSKRLQQEVQLNHELGQALRVSGTPTYIIGDKVLAGAVGYDALKQAITEARNRS